MKKLLCFVFLILISVYPVFACASSVKEPLPVFSLLSRFSVDDLLRTVDFINSELEDRGYSETILYPGEYIVGNEILQGKYTLSSYPEDGGGAIMVYSADGEGGYVGSIMYNPYSHVSHSLKEWELLTVELEEGDTLKVIGSSPLIFYTYDGI